MTFDRFVIDWSSCSFIYLHVPYQRHVQFQYTPLHVAVKTLTNAQW